VDERTALDSLRRRSEWLQSKLDSGTQDERNAGFTRRDIAVNDVAIAAVEFVLETQRYEAALTGDKQ
jgi:hypothetical protein